MQHRASHHRVSMQSSHVSPYAPEWILRSAQLSQPSVVMLHHSPRYPGSASPWRHLQILACAFSWWPLKKASQTHIAKRTTQLWHSGCTTIACVSQTEPSYTRIGWSFLRNEVLRTLHSAYQRVSSMESRTPSILFRPDIPTVIQETRDRCHSCNKTAPSQAATPPAALDTPSIPLQSIFADFCDYGGCHYLVVGDHLSGWVDIYETPPSTSYSGDVGLIACLRQMFATFGVPEILFK